MTSAEQLPEPAHCYVDGCARDNELMLHVADDPWLGGDYCMEHAREFVTSTPLIMTCECPICARARRVLPEEDRSSILSGPGRWLVTTETSAYALELGESDSGTLVRHVEEGQGHDPEAIDLPPPARCRTSS